MVAPQGGRAANRRKVLPTAARLLKALQSFAAPVACSSVQVRPLRPWSIRLSSRCSGGPVSP
eukprot:2883202-Alexandrium_andersonii.AAC.1